ncbi:DUF881 domain-containing protein [Kineococcus rhizosphaerae]|uniref:Uncharacterized protein YlxW (UPF0749 family) n=1 Tax=Kineococcus rhizosphaerae TaxID=559628 RepID=A0A2T0R9J1_9ACTN|nr:DUF881 domain-containing protein [Kineococcus rhizosphaerae]PRY17823.1 uncharacterized protein YlxW (UPF0749 family) [Kineococcus rhizosphaerae]
MSTPAPTPAPGTAPAPGPRANPWRRLWRAAGPRATRGQLLAGVLCAALGFGVVVQVRQTNVSGLADLRESDLVRILDDTTERGDRLAGEVQDLQATRQRLTQGSDQAQAAADAAAARAQEYGLLAGTLAAHGPGIVATITDPGAKLRSTNLIQLVQELRDSGAEAVQVGTARVVAQTAFTDGSGGVLVDGVLQRSPYVVTVVGDPSTLATAMDIPGGVRETLRSAGADLVVDQAPGPDGVRVTALHAVSAPQYARPASPAP